MAETAALTTEQKLDVVIEHLTTSHLLLDGGYPYACRWIGDTLAVAGLDYDRAATMDTYERADLIAWFDRAALMAAEDGEPADEAFAYLIETYPTETKETRS